MKNEIDKVDFLGSNPKQPLATMGENVVDSFREFMQGKGEWTQADRVKTNPQVVRLDPDTDSGRLAQLINEFNSLPPG
jgi:hypothetical protein